MDDSLLLAALMLGGLTALPAAHRRLQLSRAKHPSLAGHARIARRLAAWLPGFAYDEAEFFTADAAEPTVAARRRAAFMQLAERLNVRHQASVAMTKQARASIPDLAFTAAYRVPYPFSPYLRRHLSVGAFVTAADGVTVTDLDGQTLLDVTGSYGVNLFGVDFYRTCIDEGSAMVRALGPVLGAYHPCVVANVERIRRISGHDAVSFHMSGTEAVMQAVRLARYHTGRSHVVRFCGAYHGWWDDVQPGPGNPLSQPRTYTLKDMDARTLRVLATRRDIACVLVNPLQALHPNSPAPGDSALVDGARQAAFDRDAYAEWLQRLRTVCSARGIVLILDEVFMGFRLAPGGAQEYFGVRADMVTYGKTLGGGLPVGVLCGRAALMRRYRDDHPADICFARGTFNTHPYVMGAMHAFLDRLQRPEVLALYDGLDARFDGWAARLNEQLARADVPVRVANMSSVWTVLFTHIGRYHWMLQFYLRAQRVALSWVGSGRLILGLNWTEADFAELARRFVAAAMQMRDDGWWLPGGGDQSASAIRRSIVGRAVRQRLQRFLRP